MWGLMVEQIARMVHGGSVALFLGATDAGKSTLIRQLHERVGGEIVDGDVGQAWIGPPAVVSLGTPEGARAGYFVGDVSPRGNLLQVTTGIGLMTRRAARPCLIDTDGYIGDGAAVAYKTELVNLVRPDLLVLMQRRDELGYFNVFARKGVSVVDVPVEHHSAKTREERMQRRVQAFLEYFGAAGRRRWSLQDVWFERGLLGRGEALDVGQLSIILGCEVRAAWKAGRAVSLVVDSSPHTLGTAKRVLDVDVIHLYHWNSLRDLLIGCLRDGEYHGLGVLKDLTPEAVSLWTPVEGADVLQLGSLRVGEDGHHDPVRISPEIRSWA